ncbi:MAG: hypothetical protein ACO1Q7_13940 [Gemmatimonas sp.]
MIRSITRNTLPGAVALAAALVAAPNASAQSGKWVATISNISIEGKAAGAADITVEPGKDDTKSKAKIVFRNSIRETRISWDIVQGNCRDEGQPIAPGATFRKAMTSMDGSATVTNDIPKLQSGKAYYVRVYDPQTVATDANAYGCGNLSEKP